MRIPAPKSLLLAYVALMTGLQSLSAEIAVDVTGLGLFRNASYERRLEFLGAVPGASGEAPALVNIEDTAYILLQLLKREGYARPEVRAVVEFVESPSQEMEWTLPFVAHADRNLAGGEIVAIRYVCDPGVLSFYDKVEVTGVDVIEASTIQEFFIPSGILFTGKRERAFTDSNLDSRIARLLGALRNEGYQKAKVTGRKVTRDQESGAVDVRVEMVQGPLHEVGTVHVEVEGAAGEASSRSTEEHAGALLNTQWQRAVRQSIHNTWYERGYPDSTIRVERQPATTASGGTLRVDVVFRVNTGPQVTLSGISFQPEGLLKESVMKRQVKLDAGEPFNLLQVEEGRRRLLSLGVLEEVSVEQNPTGSGEREAVYTLEALPSQSLSLSVGWGSYEQGRIGAKWKHMNMWGRAHRYELGLRKSFKAFNADGRYLMPQFFDEENTAYLQVGHASREEIDFDRSTSEIVFGVSRQLQFPGAEASLEYSFENVDTTRDSDSEFDSLDRATVSSLSLNAILDRRDSVIYPTEGFDLSLHLKTATKALGGETDFHKTELTSSFHKYLGSALYLHAALEYGIIFSRSPVAENLPFNERFFPGGENSIRGYQRGEAAPLTDSGQVIGAESYGFASVELEQRLFRNYSLVVFWDGLGISEQQAALPDGEFLQSIGVGIRWRTPVGPVRLEYGHNLDPRPGDPDGTLHLAVGYPF